MSEPLWYFSADGQRREGPIPESDLRGRLAEGRLPTTTLVWTDGMPDWIPAGQAGLTGSGMPGGPPTVPAAPPPTPAALYVFGSLNIAFGAITLLCTPFGLTAMKFSAQVMPMTEAYKYWTIFSVVVSLVAGGFLLAAGIGLLRRQAWARKLSRGYGWFTVAWTVISIPLTLWLLYTSQVESGSAASPEMIGGYVGALVGGMIGLIYPILLIVFMGRPNVVTACDR
jgi:hypothetical protein